MVENKNSEGWVWVIVHDQADSGHYLGLHSEDDGVDFIPVFISREAADDCYLNLPRQKGHKYEIQAVHIDELTADAKKNGFTIAFVDNNGKIVDRHGEAV